MSLEVEEGEFYGFIGPNGAGKSTTIRILLGLISASGGKAEILGRNIDKDGKDILSDIGYLPSEAMFYSGMKVKDIIEFSAKLRKRDCMSEAKLLCERLELDMSRKVDELSLGNRKKVGIVCALQHRPSLYILDEPTGGLDPLMQREFYSILKERNADGATVFLSSHVLSEVGRYCTHAGVIKDGRLLVSDKVDALGHTGVKRVSLKGAEIGSLSGIENIRDVKQVNEAVSFLYSGEAEKLIKILSTLCFEDITVTDPDLEEVFMHYYAKEEN